MGLQKYNKFGLTTNLNQLFINILQNDVFQTGLQRYENIILISKYIFNYFYNTY